MLYKIKYIIVILILLSSCEKDQDAMRTQLEVVKEQFTPSYTSATLQCSFATKATLRNVYVQYATTQDFVEYDEMEMSKADDVYSVVLDSLQDNTTYYVRYAVSNLYSSAMIEEISTFQTLQPSVPTIALKSISDIWDTHAKAEIALEFDGGFQISEMGICWNTQAAPVVENNKLTIKDTIAVLEIKDLQPNTQYFVRAYAINKVGVAYSEQKSFITMSTPHNNNGFSISSSKQVVFSSGNLQYTKSTQTWSFAENQWDMIGTDNVTGGSVSSAPNYGEKKSGTALADKIDLFGWSTSATNFGVSTSESSSDYSGSFVDWGTNKIGNDAPNTWRTLTYDEWRYLRWERSNYSELCGVAQVNGVNGLILLPDTWTCPSGVTFKSGFHSNSGVDYYEAYQTFTADQWSKLEAAGAVFLPATGSRFGSNVTMVQCYCNYWSATEGDGDYAGYFGVRSDTAGMGRSYRYTGKSVRLVKDL